MHKDLATNGGIQELVIGLESEGIVKIINIVNTLQKDVLHYLG